MCWPDKWTTPARRAQAVAATLVYREGKLTTLESGNGGDEALDAGTSIYLGTTLFEGVPLRDEVSGDLLQAGKKTRDSERYGPIRYLAWPILDGDTQVGTIVVASDVGVRNHTVLVIVLASLVFIVLTLAFTFFALRATIVRA